MQKNITVIAGSAIAVLMVGFTAHAADMADHGYGMPIKISFGEVEARVGGILLDGGEVDNGEDDAMLFGGVALRAGTVSESGWVLQGGLLGELTDTTDDDSYLAGIGGAVHVAKRIENYLLGVFGGYVFTAQDEDSDQTSGRAFAGVEAQRYFDDVTLYGQLGWLDGDWGNDDNGHDSVSKAVFGRAMVRYFVNPATRLDLSAAGFYGQMDDDFEDFTRGGSVTAAVEHQLHDGPYSIYTGYEFGYYHQNEDSGFGGNPAQEEVMEHTVWAGLKYRFGIDGTLKQQDRDRPSLDLPPLLRWVGQTGGPLE